MARIIEVGCRQCGTTSTQLDGAIMAGYLLRCVQCGQDELVRWEDVRDPEDNGLNSGAETSDGRDARVEALAGSCACGGNFTLGAGVRCRDCRSLDVDITHVGSAD